MRRAAESFRNPPKDEELEALLTVSATLPFVQMRTRFGFILEERGATEV